MNIALAAGSMTLTKADGSLQAINTTNFIDVTAHQEKVYSATADLDYQTSLPQVWDPATGTWVGQQISSTVQWYVLINLIDGDIQKLEMGKQSGAGAGWTNDLTGANAAVVAIRTVFA